jgi:hypothetical protein
MSSSRTWNQKILFWGILPEGKPISRRNAFGNIPLRGHFAFPSMDLAKSELFLVFYQLESCNICDDYLNLRFPL